MIARTTPRTPTRPGFTMTELLVVISIIVVLAGVLLVAMKGVRTRALYTKTEATMQSFSAACDTFKMEHNRYPGIIPEAKLAFNPVISGTENALLDMMGGVVRGDDPLYDSLSPPQWVEIDTDGTLLGKIKVNLAMLGEGPRINGTPYSPYYGGQLEIAAGQENSVMQIPDVLDAWGQPVVYLRQVRTTGPLVGVLGSSPPPQFLLGPGTPYTSSVSLGKLAKDQLSQVNGSILNRATPASPEDTLAQIIRHPAVGKPDEPRFGNARGSYVLLSAGSDGIFFSIADGPGTHANPIEDIVNGGNPKLVEEYDDIRRFGG